MGSLRVQQTFLTFKSNLDCLLYISVLSKGKWIQLALSPPCPCVHRSFWIQTREWSRVQNTARVIVWPEPTPGAGACTRGSLRHEWGLSEVTLNNGSTFGVLSWIIFPSLLAGSLTSCCCCCDYFKVIIPEYRHQHTQTLTKDRTQGRGHSPSPSSSTHRRSPMV